MKKLLYLILLIPAVAFSEVTISATPMDLLDENGVPIEGVTKSTSREKLMEKASKQGNGVYRGQSNITITVTGQGEPVVVVPPVVVEPEPEPLVCEEGFEPNGTGDACIAIVPEPDPVPEPEPPVVEPPIVSMGNMPKVDLSKQPAFGIGSAEMLIRNTTLNEEQPKIADANTGQFREPCKFSHMNNDDFIVYPNHEGAAHHHTYFGNTNAKHDTDPKTLAKVGTSTCSGGMANGSAYWMPSLIDTSTNSPLKPRDILVYYKTDTSDTVVTPPTGLRMIANIKRVKENPNTSYGQWENTHKKFTCYDTKWNNVGSNKYHIPDCAQGNILNIDVSFPTCWDGVNLDSPDHASHVMYRSDNNYVCPAGWKKLPEITYNVKYNVTSPSGTKNWRLSSDDYVGGRGGYSAHGDWVNGWDEGVLKAIVENCLQGGLDCHAELLGNGSPSQRLFLRDQYHQNTVAVPLREK